jgi:hypothetical protein
MDLVEDSRPVVSRLTRVERALWGRALERQHRSGFSKYRQNLHHYGPEASTYLSVGLLWLLPCYPVFALSLLFLSLGDSALFASALILGFALSGIAGLRVFGADKAAQQWRLAHGLSVRSSGRTTQPIVASRRIWSDEELSSAPGRPFSERRAA